MLQSTAAHKVKLKLVKFNRKSRLKVQLLVLIVLQTVGVTFADNSFCYVDPMCGPANWQGLCSTGKSQSPINIPTTMVTAKQRSARITLNKNYALPKLFFVKNTGHTIQLMINANEKSKCYLTGEGLGPNAYYFSQLHFHWGPNNLLGSEHRLSGKAYPLEMHMVHRELKDNEKIAVLSILFYLSPYDNKQLSKIFRFAGKVTQPGDVTKTSATNTITLSSLLPKKLRMFRYIGSLTRPPCTENVTWTVFQDPLPVSKKQMAILRKLNTYDNKPITRNFRPIQPVFTSARKSIFFLRQLKTNQQALYWDGHSGGASNGASNVGGGGYQGQGQQVQQYDGYPSPSQGHIYDGHPPYFSPPQIHYDDYFWDWQQWQWHHNQNQNHYYEQESYHVGPGPVPPTDAEFEWIDLASVVQ